MKTLRTRTFLLVLTVAITAGGVGVFFSAPMRSVQAATCPFVDNDANDSDATVGTYSLNTNFSVPAAASAYDCTSASGITTFKVPSPRILTLQSNLATGEIAQMNFTDLEVQSGGTITASGQGCANTAGASSNGFGPNGSNICTVTTAGYGPAGTGGGGGGHGGAGAGGTGSAGGIVYDSATAPALFGSSGGNSPDGNVSAAGGGIIRIDVGGSLTHNGTISANGNNGISSFRAGGAGSGGSVYMTVGTIAGTTGTFHAKGGAGGSAQGGGNGGGGGGGRIAIVYASGSFAFDSADFDVSGGTTPQGSTAAKGTVYVRETTNNDVSIFHGFTWTDTDWSVRNFVSDASATNQYCDSSILSSATPSVTASGLLTLGGSLNCGPAVASWTWSTAGTLTFTASASVITTAAMSFTGTSAVSIGSGVVITDNAIGTDITLNIPAGTQTWTNVTINAPVRGYVVLPNALDLTLAGTTAVNANVQWTNLTNLTIASTASVSATGKGCNNAGAASSNGFGPNGSNVCTLSTAGYGGGGGTGGAGAGHGGTGAVGGAGTTAGRATYGSPTAPVLFGSSGGNSPSGVNGGTGGGYIRITVSGTFTHNGIISATGNAGVSAFYGGGGGSGGSVYVTAPVLNGTTGTFLARGGNGGGAQGGGGGGGGGGGRIAVLYASGSFSFDSADFDLTAGTQGSPAAAKGTVYVNETTNNDVTIFHGFTWFDTDWSVRNWVADASATNQYCDASVGSGATPSVSGTNVTLGGTLSCTQTTSWSFSATGAMTVSASANYSVTSALTLAGTSSFSIGSGATLTDSAAGTDITLNIPAGTQSWTNVTINGAVRGYVVLPNALDLTLAGTTAINSNVQWTNLTNLTVATSASIAATGKGCNNAGSASSHGYGPDGSNVCTIATAGYGGGGGSGGAGAGHGGLGGAGSGNSVGRATYGSATAPILFGSSGGNSPDGANGGTGGGYVRIDVSGTLSNNGTISANGNAGLTAFRGGGGGSGGSVYVSVSTITGTTGTFRANGGNGGGAAGGGYGGGGGGGRISILYVIDSSTYLAGLTAAGTATGGTSGSGAGATGTLNVQNTNPPPSVTVVSHSPASPFTTDPVTLSGTATDNAGIVKIEIFLDGTAPANLKHTCNIAPTTPATCSIGVGTLSGGSHTTTIRAYDAILQMAQGTENFSVGGATTAGQMILGRSKVSVSTSFTLAFALSGTSTGTLTVTFPAQFTVTAAGTGGASSACLSSFGFTATTLTATKTACSGTVTLGGATITNPATPGTYVINWTNDSGSGSVYITSDDQITVTANVDPILTFNVGSQAAATACDGTFTGNGGTIALGTISTGSVTSSDAASVSHICTRVTTNGTLGANITVKSLNASLKSTSTPADAIPSSTTTLVAGTAGYGLCAGSAGGDSSKDTTVPVGATPARSAPFNGASCTSTGHDIGALTTVAQSLWTLAAASQNAFLRLYVKAAISPTTPAHNDYADTLTFVATGTY